MDRLFSTLAQDFSDAGYGVRGVVQSNEERPGDHPCDMDIKVLPEGPELRISQALGKGSRGCRLDPSVLEQAGMSVLHSLDADADLLLINKYGKHEAHGRGLCDAIVKAVEMELPVLCGLNDLNRQAFMDFTGDLAEQLQPESKLLKSWLLDAVSTRPARVA